MLFLQEGSGAYPLRGVGTRESRIEVDDARDIFGIDDFPFFDTNYIFYR
jgi:hypothetical protein